MRSIAMLLFLLLAACSALGPSPASEPPRHSQDAIAEDVRESVCRYLFTESRQQMRNKLDVHFLEFEAGRVLPAEFLARFRGDRIPVAPASDATVLEDGSPIDAVRHRQNGGTGCLFWVGEPRATADGAYEVKGGYYQGKRASSEHVYRVERQGDAWVVTDDIMTTIS